MTVNLKQDGVPLCMLLDLVEVARLHSGMNLAEEFAKILGDFGISKKVRNSQQRNQQSTHQIKDSQCNLW